MHVFTDTLISKNSTTRRTVIDTVADVAFPLPDSKRPQPTPSVAQWKEPRAPARSDQ